MYWLTTSSAVLHVAGTSDSVGIDRYTKTTDLTIEERRYLHKEGRLAFLNFCVILQLAVTNWKFRRASRYGCSPLVKRSG